jgi:hypothetical protein
MAQRKRVAVDFRQVGVPMLLQNSAVALADGLDTTVSITNIKGNYFETYYGAASTDIIYTPNANGLVIPNDNTDNEGVEITNGIAATHCPVAFTVGTDAAFFFSVKFGIPDVSDYDVGMVGFRAVEAYQAVANIDTPAETITRYTDLAGFNVNAGDIYTMTRNNSGTGVLTDSTDNWADGEYKTLTVKVSAAGVCTFFVDGAAPTVNTNTITLAAAKVVVPFFRFTKGAAASDTPPILQSWVCSYQ